MTDFSKDLNYHLKGHYIAKGNVLGRLALLDSTAAKRAGVKH